MDIRAKADKTLAPGWFLALFFFYPARVGCVSSGDEGTYDLMQ
jgi:hypothetical protein